MNMFIMWCFHDQPHSQTHCLEAAPDNNPRLQWLIMDESCINKHFGRIYQLSQHIKHDYEQIQNKMNQTYYET